MVTKTQKHKNRNKSTEIQNTVMKHGYKKTKTPKQKHIHRNTKHCYEAWLQKHKNTKTETHPQKYQTLL